MKNFYSKLAIILAICLVVMSTVPAFAATIPEGGAEEQIAEQTDEQTSAQDDGYVKASSSNAEYAEEKFIREVTVDGIRIVLKADPGVFPENAELYAERVEDEDIEEAIEEAVEKERDDTASVASNYKFDIMVLVNGVETQPDTSKGELTITFIPEEKVDNCLEMSAYHLKEDAKGNLEAETLEEVVKTEETEEAEDSEDAEEILEDGALINDVNDEVDEYYTDSFSYYVVEFTYKELQYVLEGDSSVKLSEILAALKIDGTATDAVSGAPELFSVEKDAEGDDWTVTALQAFSSKEWMKVTAGGTEYTIIVTDSNGDPSWFIDANGVLTISGPVTYDWDSSPWYENTDIKSVITKPGAKINNCNSLFYGCENLVSADLSNLDTSDVTNMADMFSQCSILEKIDLSMFDTSKVIHTDFMFTGCKALQELDLSNFNTSNVMYMSSMFKNCENLKTIWVSNNFKTDKVMPFEGEYIFHGCINLKGGAGTTFDSSIMNKDTTYARIDDPAHGKPGLFSEKKPLKISTAKSEYKIGEVIDITIKIDKTLLPTEIDLTDGTHIWHLAVDTDGKSEFHDATKTAAGTYTYIAYVADKSNIKDEVTVTVKGSDDPVPKKDSSSGSSLFTGTSSYPVSDGKWTQNADGTWSYVAGRRFTSTWGCIANPAEGGKANWYYFDVYGRMLTGWHKLYWNGAYRWFYFIETKDANEGKCQLGGITPDGYIVDESGAWIEN